MKHLSLLTLALSLFITLPPWAGATGLQPEETSEPVEIQAVDFNLEMHGLYVAGVMEVQFMAGRGSENAANLRFPLPPNAVLYKAEIFLPKQENWMMVETVGRQEGQQIYNEIVYQQKYDPLLIQRIGTDFYRARVFPINADGDLRMRVYYAHLLETGPAGDYLLRVPFANKDATSASPTEGVNISLLTDAEAWTARTWQVGDELGSPGTTVDLSKGMAFLTLTEFKMDKDVTLSLQPTTPLSKATSVFYQPDSMTLPGHLHVWWQPDFTGYPEVSAQSRNVVFVMDVSGSMGGEKIQQMRKAVITCLEALSEGDYFGLVAFDSDFYVFRDTMSSVADRQLGSQWVMALQAGSGTGMAAGLSQGAALGVTSTLREKGVDLLLITDGLPNVGSSTVEDILSDVGRAAEDVGSRLRIFSVGIGYDLDQRLLNGLTQRTGGESTFALKDTEITGQILDLFGRVRGGGVANVTVSIQGLGVTEKATLHWSRLFPDLPLQLGAKGNGISEVTVKLSGTAGLNSIELNTSPTPLTLASGNSKMARMAAPLAAKAWADALERQIDQEGESSAQVNQAVQLARTYGIVTRYSSLLALESEEMYAQYGIKRIARDPAGIALEPVELSSVDENQVGGEGTEEGEEMTLPTSPPPRPEPLPMPYPMGKDTSAGAEVTFEEAGIAPSMPEAKADSANAFEGWIADTMSGEVDGAAADKDEATCEWPVLDETLQLHIPQLNYAGKSFWATLQLDSLSDGALVLDVLEYGEITQPKTACQAVFLSDKMRLYIPLLYYRAPTGEKMVTEVILKLLPTPDGQLRFKVFDFK